MRKNKMKRRSKVMAVILSLAMIVPLMMSQTVAVNATTVSESGYLQLKSTATSVPLEKNDEFTLELQAKKAFQSTMGIEGQFTYKEKENGKEKVDQYFDIIKVTPDAAGWASYYDNDTGKFGIVRSSLNPYSSGAANSKIASITFRVKKAVDQADIVLDLLSFSAYENVTSGGTLTTKAISEDKTDSAAYTVTCQNLQNTDKTRTVTFANDKDITAKVAQIGGTNKEFQVPVELTANSGFNAIQMKFSYSGNMMSYTGYEIPPKMRAYLPSVTERTETIGTDTNIYISMAGKDDMKLTGQFIILKFMPASITTQGQTATMKFSVEQIYNSSSKIPTATFTNPTSTVNFTQGSSKGDVCIDNVINLIDVTYALQYYNGVRPQLTPEQIDNAEVNGDGKVNLVDVLMILKKANGENVNF